jgi:hypothetical protein
MESINDIKNTASSAMESLDNIYTMMHALTQAIDETVDEPTKMSIYKRTWEIIGGK